MPVFDEFQDGTLIPPTLGRMLRQHGGVPQKKTYFGRELLARLARESVVIPYSKSNVWMRHLTAGACHENCEWLSAESQEADSRCQYTGFALGVVPGTWAENEVGTRYKVQPDDDQHWYEHSWVMNPKRGTLIETTIARRKYLGVLVDRHKPQCVAFDRALRLRHGLKRD